MQVGTRVTPRAGRAGAAAEDRLGTLAPSVLDEIDPPPCAWIRYQRDAVAPKSCRHRAVEGVNPELDPGDQVVDVADPEEVPRPLRRRALQFRRRPGDNLVHLLF